MGWIDRLRRRRSVAGAITQDELASKLNGGAAMSKGQALAIPAVAGAVEFIAGQAASLPLRLYREEDGRVREVQDDPRLQILNDDNGDGMSGYQWRKAAVRDYLLMGRAYLYRNIRRNQLISLHYVDEAYVTVIPGTDPIYKSSRIQVNGQTYRDYDFVRILRNSRDGATGYGIIQESSDLLWTMDTLQKFERIMVASGGNRRGVFQAKKQLSREMLEEVRDLARRIYSGDSTAAMVLNSNIEFTQTSATPVEMQMTQLATQLNHSLYQALNLPPGVLEDGNDAALRQGVRMAVMPVLSAFEAALNKDLLLESEKGTLFFAFDTREMLKGDMESRYRAYGEALRDGWISINEVRYREDMDPIAGMDVLSMSLASVIYDTNTQSYFVPNTSLVQSGGAGGGSKNGDPDTGG